MHFNKTFFCPKCALHRSWNFSSSISSVNIANTEKSTQQLKKKIQKKNAQTNKTWVVHLNVLFLEMANYTFRYKCQEISLTYLSYCVTLTVVSRLRGDLVLQGGCAILIKDFHGSPKKPGLTLLEQEFKQDGHLRSLQTWVLL